MGVRVSPWVKKISWPKAYINHNGEKRKVTVWGCRPRANVLAVEMYDGKEYTSTIIPINNVIHANTECLTFFPYLKECKNIKVYADGYGASIKQKIYEQENEKG